MNLIFLCVFSVTFAVACSRFYERMPARWLCEYDEEPGELQMPGFRNVRPVRMAVGAAVVWFYFAWEWTARMDNKAELTAFVAGIVTLLAAGVILCLISFSDMEYMIIPDQLVLLLFGVVLVRTAALQLHGVDAHMFRGALYAAGPMVLCTVVSGLMYRTECIGSGDIKLLAVCGALVGDAGIMVFVYSVIICGVISAVMMVISRGKDIRAVPMGPWISVSTGMCLLTGAL